MISATDHLTELVAHIGQQRPDLVVHRVARAETPTLAVLDYDIITVDGQTSRQLRAQVNVVFSYIRSGPSVGRVQVALTMPDRPTRYFRSWPLSFPAILAALGELLAERRAQGEYKTLQAAELEKWVGVLDRLRTQLGPSKVIVSFKGLQPIVTLHLTPRRPGDLPAVLEHVKKHSYKVQMRVSVHQLPVETAGQLVEEVSAWLEPLRSSSLVAPVG